ncbi:nucleic-acid-binding protein from mobile element jockey [Plakobranchus ocellatus]|uniref:Nucleic-acid-binding protein from mobile element jockey n=1 Tax=Plakobranchus ocellatus TaxID=259542 RepID=A0AAV3ZIG3_9GAST|nr:nucleic-acid-binding protein from mobile element jockey [Plakobranchus ocellatus]
MSHRTSRSRCAAINANAMTTAKTGVRKYATVRCGKGGHVERDCSADPHCVNCRGDHAASSMTCPKFVKEQAILRYKAENGVTFQ